MKSIIAFALCGVFVLGSASALDWVDRYEVAARNAKADHKLILLDFTGSDWCGYCKLLDKEVLSTPEFEQYAEANFECVTLDYPHEKEIPEMIKEQNAELQRKFKIDGFPTLIVLDADGNEQGRIVGYNPGSGPDAVITQLKSYDKR